MKQTTASADMAQNPLLCAVNSAHKFNVDRKDFYEYDQPAAINVRTRERLVEIADIGMEEVMTAEFGYKGIMSGLYLEKVWSYSNKDWKDYIDWAKGLINERSA
jgi:hypothetical protein